MENLSNKLACFGSKGPFSLGLLSEKKVGPYFSNKVSSELFGSIVLNLCLSKFETTLAESFQTLHGHHGLNQMDQNVEPKIFFQKWKSHYLSEIR